MYCITRLDLPQPVRSVQIGHALIAATLAFGDAANLQTHPHLVICAVTDEVTLNEAFERLKKQNCRVCSYREDDLDDALTAVATAPLAGADREPLRYFPLMRN